MAKIKEQSRIPVTKVQRASKFIFAGAKIGTNYLKHYGRRLVNPNLSRDALHEDNATDIYNSLSQLKGSALKVAQMLSMDKNLLPSAYQQKFAMAQYSAPPLSYPLVVKTFEQAFKKKPAEIFESFTISAVNAASMGQVHQATLKKKKMAVKIQYPGVSDTIKSDLAMVKPIALTMFKLNPAEYDEFIGEVQVRLLEEANYTLELERSQQLSKKCRDIPNLVFPNYYPSLSSPKILTMDWIEGQLLGEYLKTKRKSGTGSDRIGQAMWDFYHYQIHFLKTLHADPHPGNFIITSDGKLGVIDFGCVKVIPPDFYKIYFQLLDPDILVDKAKKEKVFEQLHFIYPEDSQKDRKFFTDVFTTLVELLGRPFHTATFDFSEESYFNELFKFGEEIGKLREFRESTRARGVKDAVYINRTYYGLYNLLHDLNAKIDTTSFVKSVK
jgi:predicted unusual protein kinase regulating ubiquinone biosynthesis (AarF/ABC1/UbiB family)